MEDNKGKIGNEILAAITGGAFIFALVIYVVVSLFEGWIIGLICAVIVFALVFSYITSKIGKYEK